MLSAMRGLVTMRWGKEERMNEINNVTIIGMGGLGTMFGYQIQNRIGREHVAFIMDEARPCTPFWAG